MLLLYTLHFILFRGRRWRGQEQLLHLHMKVYINKNVISWSPKRFVRLAWGRRKSGIDFFLTIERGWMSRTFSRANFRNLEIFSYPSLERLISTDNFSFCKRLTWTLLNARYLFVAVSDLNNSKFFSPFRSISIYPCSAVHEYEISIQLIESQKLFRKITINGFLSMMTLLREFFNCMQYVQRVHANLPMKSENAYMNSHVCPMIYML